MMSVCGEGDHLLDCDKDWEIVSSKCASQVMGIWETERLLSLDPVK